jgi:cell division protein ZapB
MTDTENFEETLDRLMELCQRLKRDNQALQAREDELLGERSKLMKKNEQARHKVETMINRLQALSAEQ